ncbi:MAG: hypothetical protein ACREMZ_15925 [Gemmatimonadales bacterium]
MSPQIRAFAEVSASRGQRGQKGHFRGVPAVPGPAGKEHHPSPAIYPVKR